MIREGADRGDGEDDKIYYFFTEVSVEYEFFSKLLIPRVARVCKVSVHHIAAAFLFKALVPTFCSYIVLLTCIFFLYFFFCVQRTQVINSHVTGMLCFFHLSFPKLHSGKNLFPLG